MKVPVLSFYTAVFALFVLLSYGCNNTNSTQNNEQQPTAEKIKQEETSLNETLKKLDVPSQIFSAPGDQLSLIKGKKGTVIFLTPKDLETEDGQAPGNKIVVELKELTNAAELARANAQTLSDGKLLVSGGAYYVNMTSDGKKLKIRNGRSLKIAFPKITDTTMMLFNGQRDSTGQMNWQPTNEQLSAKNGYGVDTRDTGDGKSIMVYNPKSYKLMGYVGSEKAYKRDYAALGSIKEREKYTAELEKRGATLRDSISTEKMKEIVTTTQKLNASLYDITSIRQLGWINCDRFSTADKTNISYTIDPKDSIYYARVFIVYKQINSVVAYSFFNTEVTGTRELAGLPIGYQARMIATANKNGELVTSKMDVTIVNNQQTVFKWRKTTTEELNSYFDAGNNWGQ